MSHNDRSRWSWGDFWIGLDQWINTWPIPFLGRGKPDETISSKAGRAEHGHWWAWLLCRFLGLFDRGHCAKAVQAERDLIHLPPELREMIREELRRRAKPPETPPADTS